MDYMIIFNEKLKAYENNYHQMIATIEKIIEQSKNLHNYLYKKDIFMPEINGYITRLIDLFDKLDKINNTLFLLEQEFKDTNVRIKREYPNYNENDLINIESIKPKLDIENIVNKRLILFKLSKSLGLIDVIFKGHVANITPEYTNLISLLDHLNNEELVKYSSEKELEEYNNIFYINKSFNKENLYLIGPKSEIRQPEIHEDIEEPIEEKKETEIDRLYRELNKKPIKKIIIEAQEGSIENYEVYLANKYARVDYKPKYEGNTRLPYPHEKGEDFFLNDSNEQVIISRNYGNKNYYEEVYLPYIKQNNVSMEEILSCINSIKNRIYDTIAKSLLAKNEQITEKKFNLILRYICENNYSTADHLKYKVEYIDGYFCLNIFYKSTKVEYKLEYDEMLKTYDELYKKVLPRTPILNPSIRNKTTMFNIIYSDDSTDNELDPETRNRYIRLYLKQRLKNWTSGSRYESIGDIKDVLQIDIYTASGKCPIEMNRIERAKVI